MATNSTTSTIGAAGDYTSIASWAADIGTGLGTSTNLVTDDYDHTAEVLAEVVNVNTTVPTLTSDATHHLYITAAAAAALMDDDARTLVYNTSYATLSSIAGYSNGLKLTNNTFVEISRLQFNKATGNKKCIQLGADNSMHRCLINTIQGGGSYSTFYAGARCSFTSLLIVNLGSVGVSIAKDTSSNVTNCSLVLSDTAALSPTAIQSGVGYGRPEIHNCAFFSDGAPTEVMSANAGTAWGAGDLDYNATSGSDLSSKSGEGSNNTYSLTMTDQFNAIDNTDWGVKSGHGLNVGQDKSAVVTEDIWGNTYDAATFVCGCEQPITRPSIGTVTAFPSTATTSGEITESYTMPDMGTDGGLLVVIATQNNSTSATSGTVSFDGTAMTLVTSVVGAKLNAALYRLDAPTVGAGNLVFTLTGSVRSRVAICIPIKDADDVSIGVTNTALDDGASTAATVTVTTTTVNSLVGGVVIGYGGDTDPFAPDTDVTEVLDGATGTNSTSDCGYFAGTMNASATGAYAFGATMSVSDDWVTIGFEILVKAVAGDSTLTIPLVYHNRLQQGMY